MKKTIRHPSSNILNAKRINRLYCSKPPVFINIMLLFLLHYIAFDKLYYTSCLFSRFLVGSRGLWRKTSQSQVCPQALWADEIPRQRIQIDVKFVLYYFAIFLFTFLIITFKNFLIALFVLCWIYQSNTFEETLEKFAFSNIISKFSLKLCIKNFDL